MIYKTNKTLYLAAFGLAVFLVGLCPENSFAQDPFARRGGARTTGGGGTTVVRRVAPPKPVKPTPPPIVPIGAPPVQDRINHFMRMRESAAVANQPLPKPISVMTIDELTVTGIFQTSRGYAAMVEAKPIGLSYTMYPGEKVFDGQLVAIEDNRLVFRKVTKMSNGKFITSEASKSLRQYTEQEVVQGTAPAGAVEETKTEAPPAVVDPTKPPMPTVVISPVDEMNRQPIEKPKTVVIKPKRKN